MRKRAVAGAVFAALGARWWWSRHGEAALPALLPASTESLPERVQAFLRDFNLTERFDAELGALRTEPVPRPGLHPDAPKQKRHPVVIVPGLTSCGLEVWKAHPCLGDGFFRRRIWGEVSMAEAMLANWSCWLHHLQPDPLSGLDRDGVRVRPAKGLRSSDYFITGYWLWAKLIQNLADMGYVEDDILLACYDWRIPFPLLETRDRYLTGLRHDIEKAVSMSDERVVLIGHSMGSNLALFFMKWVEQDVPGWCERHIASFVNIAGALLGAMGPLAAYYSGEMDATAAMGPLSSYIDTLALSFDEMREIYWSMGGLGGLLPMGGSAVWGSTGTGWTDAPVDTVTFAPDMEGAPSSLEELYASLSDENSELPLHGYPAWTSYERGLLKPKGGGDDDVARLSNPLASALPTAPSMKIFCMYGVGLPTERAYSYGVRQARWRFADRTGGFPAGLPEGRIFRWSGTKPMDEVVAEMRSYSMDEATATRIVKVDAGGQTLRFANLVEAIAALEELLRGTARLGRWIRINTSRHSDVTEDPWDNNVPDGLYSYGVAKADGDSTVPLTSLGYMCSHGWKDLDEFNPGKVAVWTKEFMHDPLFILADPRGGPAAAKHVEIIGNHDLINDILHIVSGNTTHLERDHIHSNITMTGPIITERIRNELR